jgi:peptidoglycan/xylan/chitin deacetylase (PgdA/CDA1 family)
MIYLTGDVHVYDKHNWEQKKIGSEIEASKKYLDILKKQRISCTLFINGKCLKTEKTAMLELLRYDVEIGGHTYDNFGGMNKIKGYLFKKIWGCIYGPKKYQEKDIQKTKNIFEKNGLQMNSWRTHAFGSNDTTFKILETKGVKNVSDLLGNKKIFNSGGIRHFPINVPVDQNTIIYGPFAPENRDPFASCTKGRIDSKEWFNILKRRVMENEKNNIPSVILIHPATMNALDNFELFAKVAKFLSKYESFKVSEFKF